MKTTLPGIGERICAALLGHQLGISTDLAWKRYVRGKKISPLWEQEGEKLLKSWLEQQCGPAPEKPITPENGIVH